MIAEDEVASSLKYSESCKFQVWQYLRNFILQVSDMQVTKPETIQHFFPLKLQPDRQSR
jgi:hypothetical protein